MFSQGRDRWLCIDQALSVATSHFLAICACLSWKMDAFGLYVSSAQCSDEAPRNSARLCISA